MTENNEQILNGRYRVEGLIGRGGMADVYRSTDLSLHRTVAVKMLRPDLARDPLFQTRFAREAQSSASLNHPNIVGVYDVGQAALPQNGDQIKTPYIVMEHVDGVTLRHVLHGTPSQEEPAADEPLPPPPPPSDDATTEATTASPDVLGVTQDDRPDSPAISENLQSKINQALGHPLSEQDAAGYLSGILGALSYSHSRGIVHRDIKPSNVMVSNSGDVKVMDFGIARAVADSAQTMTQTSSVVGTAQYLSPEQARGEVVDHRSDLYSAGCVLFELLTNRPPFIGETPVSVAYQHVREEAPMVSDFNNRVSPAMESVVAKALTKDPAERFQSAEEFDYALGNALRGIPIADEAATSQMAAVGAGQSFDDVMGTQASSLSARTPEDPDLDTYYYQTPQPQRSPRRRVLLVLGILVLLGLVAVGAFALSRGLADDDALTVPAVATQEEEDAVRTLERAGLVPDVQSQASEDIREGLAIGTDPEVGTPVDPDSEVVLYISTGLETATVPENLEGMTLEEAEAALEQAGLSVGEVTEESHDTYDEGQVISSNPGAGTELSADESVNLVVATGTTEIPSGLIGTWRSNAEELLGQAGFNTVLDWTESDSVDFDGEVLGLEVDGNTVSSGDLISSGATVTIIAGYGPEEDEEDDPDEDEDSDDDEDNEDDEDDEDSSDENSDEDDEDEDSSDSNNDDDDE